MTDNPISKLGDLTKPATVLIEKVSDAVGGIFKPYQIVRVAKAEAEADRIRAESQIQITDLHRRAMHRFLEEEAKRQTNMESITRRALPLLSEDSSPQDLKDDWITNFFDKCRIVSDEDMQQLWARVLAGEANDPGAFSRQTVNLLADLDKGDAVLFTSLCGFIWTIAGLRTPLVFDTTSEIYLRNLIHFNSIRHLETLGLAKVDDTGGLLRLHLAKTISVSYYDKSFRLTLPNETDNKLDIGIVLLTRAGHELFSVCGSRPIDGFFDFVYEKWAQKSYVPRKTDERGG